ncbi:hypothetical protein M2271_007213 [Streptomyces sp. LBL]|uniref:hypothetical protein n=1 Tax=Streptomyces sp. LBL TaxID=2940562 RepID=UPI0024768AC0|nr:hypothetical protein [Streptomyces sp. LBL]MDH6629377.1 hypothetical protein [Streptomyces sp. LBL]
MPLPSWLQSHLPAAAPSPYTFESFADEVARLLGLPPTLRTGEFERSSETDHVWLLWKSDRYGAVLLMDRPQGELRQALVIKVMWRNSPDPADVAAMVRAYERRGRVRSLRSLLARLLRRGWAPECAGRSPAAGLPAAESFRRPDGRNQRVSAYVEIPRPYESGPDRFTVELHFPAASKRRAVEHHHVAWHLADVHGVEASSPYKVNPRWSIYEENWGNGARHGGLDERRLHVNGSPRALARYLAALTRVLDAVEGLATRAVRAFGVWKRSVAAEPHLEYEDASTMRVRSREFRADALSALVRGLRGSVPDFQTRDSSRPLWEQYGAVAAEVWAEAGGVDLAEAPEEDVAAHLARMLPAEPEQGELFAVQDVTVRSVRTATTSEPGAAVPVSVVPVRAGVRRDDPGRYGTAA